METENESPHKRNVNSLYINLDVGLSLRPIQVNPLSLKENFLTIKNRISTHHCFLLYVYGGIKLSKENHSGRKSYKQCTKRLIY